MLHLARGWLEQRLVEHGLSIEQLVQLESQSQAADQVSVSHSIASLEPGRGNFALRSGRRLWRDGFFDA